MERNWSDGNKDFLFDSDNTSFLSNYDDSLFFERVSGFTEFDNNFKKSLKRLAKEGAEFSTQF